MKILFSKFLIVSCILLLPLIIILSVINYSLERSLKEQKRTISALKQQIKEKNKEADLLYRDSAELMNEYTEPYDFGTFGIYSPLFKEKDVSVAEYNYRSSIIKKKVITILTGIPENYVYKVIAWQFFENEGKQSSFGRYDQIFALPENVEGYERGPYIAMTSIDSIRLRGGKAVKNKYGVEVIPVSYTDTPNVTSELLIGATCNPLSKPLFILIRAEQETPSGISDKYDTSRETITIQMKKIADTLSSRIY